MWVYQVYQLHIIENIEHHLRMFRHDISYIILWHIIYGCNLLQINPFTGICIETSRSDSQWRSAHLRKENVKLRAVHLIDTAYGGEKYRKSAVRAQRLFAGWFQEAWPDGKKGMVVCWVLQDM